ncbi:MAG: hypothetical protein F6J93_01935 [Oscillatoria sp. SIO1A7]|nr:hypothetical protein [Oscillatoria sp. SIO1A7]
MTAIAKLSMAAIAAATVALGIQGTLPANAVETSEVREQTAIQANETPVLLAQFVCLPEGSALVEFFETDNFQVLICEKGGRLYYHGIERGGERSGITLRAYYEEGSGYVAENGEYSYVVNSSTLSIYEGSVLLQQDLVHDR